MNIETVNNDLIISNIRNDKLTDLTKTITNAISKCMKIHIHADIDDPMDIIKATYVAMIFANRDYKCEGCILPELKQLTWFCNPV